MGYNITSLGARDWGLLGYTEGMNSSAPTYPTSTKRSLKMKEVELCLCSKALWS